MDKFMEHLYAALNSEFGVAVRCSDVARAKQKFYRARAQDSSLACITITESRFEEDVLWLVKRSEESDEEGFGEGDA